MPRRPGFTIPGYASLAGKLAQASGYAHRWTAQEARAWARVAATKSVESRRQGRKEEHADGIRG